ncbi:MAG TPA: 16S rRNA (cytidine(1402)-2'-O)-methyltransferase [Paenibacillaceae bacterium]|nr:16S rRNA (cytidine(1402)-2'-O)-methyltransferase [Paenibacillaceae bacterium]
MLIQNSFIPGNEGGKLYLVATPIGNLEDMTYRAINTLKEADFIAAEDTRQTRKLLTHFAIEGPLVSYHEHNKLRSGEEILHKLQEGKTIALVSDAGLPAISDPGEELVKEAIALGIPVIPIPGPNAALSALIASGLSTKGFVFRGFLPRGKKDLWTALESLKYYPETLIFYESPHRIEKTLKEMKEVLGSRQVALARELTKRYEEFIRGDIDEVLAYLRGLEEIRGEFTVIVSGSTEVKEEEGEAWWAELDISAHVESYLERGMDKKGALKKTAEDRGVPKREVYNIFHKS